MAYIKLENPVLYKTENDNDFIIVTHIDIEDLSLKVMLAKGRLYNYDDGEVTGGEEVEMQLDLTENGIWDVNNKEFYY